MGWVFILVAAIAGTPTGKLYYRGQKIEGQIIDFYHVASGKYRGYFPIVHFQFNGALFQFKDRVRANLIGRDIKVTVLFDPLDPQNAIIDNGFFQNWATPLTLGTFGFLTLAASIWGRPRD